MKKRKQEKQTKKQKTFIQFHTIQVTFKIIFDQLLISIVYLLRDTSAYPLNNSTLHSFDIHYRQESE